MSWTRRVTRSIATSSTASTRVLKCGCTSLPVPGDLIATVGGVVFIAGSNDARLRAFDADSGRELWADRLEASGHATPMTYRGKSGRQFVVIAAGGGGYLSRTTADVVAAYALPRP